VKIFLQDNRALRKLILLPDRAPLFFPYLHPRCGRPRIVEPNRQLVCGVVCGASVWLATCAHLVLPCIIRAPMQPRRVVQPRTEFVEMSEKLSCVM